jgi:hypothetical protein
MKKTKRRVALPRRPSREQRPRAAMTSTAASPRAAKSKPCTGCKY